MRERPLGLLLATALLLVGCSEAGYRDMCANQIEVATVSPSGLSKAVVFTRDCGATTGFSTQISILPSSRALPGEGGNVLVIIDRVHLSVKWESDTSLEVHGTLPPQVFKQESWVSGVKVSYAK